MIEIPTAPKALPLAGHIIPLLRDPLGFLLSLPSYGDLVKIRVGPMEAIVVCHPELVQHMLLRDRAFDKGGLIWDRAREVGGNGLATCPHADHRRQRRMLQPAFHHSKLPGYAAVMTEQVAEVTGTWRNGQTIDVLTEMRAMTMRVLIRTIFAAPAQASITDDFNDAVEEIMAGVSRRMLTPWPLDRVPTPGKRRYDRARARMRAITDHCVAEYRREGIDHGDLLSMMLAVRDDHQPLSDTEIWDQVTTILIAGSDSTAAALSWALWLLAGHPDVERRLHQEVDATLAGRAATWDDLPNLAYTRQVVTETLRLYPPLWLNTRNVPTDTELGGHSIPAGSRIIFSPNILHHRPNLWEDPGHFNPERWAGMVAQRLPRGAFVAFGAGPRKCVGDDFAMTAAVLMLASITARRRLQAIDTNFRPALRAVMAPTGLRMRVINRPTLAETAS